MPEKSKTKIFKYAAIYIVALFLLFGVFQVVSRVRAGNLNPGASPAATMDSLEDVYNITVGTYDSSGVSADADGDILEQLKAIKERMGM